PRHGRYGRHARNGYVAPARISRELEREPIGQGRERGLQRQPFFFAGGVSRFLGDPRHPSGCWAFLATGGRRVLRQQRPKKKPGTGLPFSGPRYFECLSGRRYTPVSIIPFYAGTLCTFAHIEKNVLCKRHRPFRLRSLTEFKSRRQPLWRQVWIEGAGPHMDAKSSRIADAFQTIPRSDSGFTRL